jgi:hypothetical protein
MKQDRTHLWRAPATLEQHNRDQRRRSIIWFGCILALACIVEWWLW